MLIFPNFCPRKAILYLFFFIWFHLLILSNSSLLIFYLDEISNCILFILIIVFTTKSEPAPRGTRDGIWWLFLLQKLFVLSAFLFWFVNLIICGRLIYLFFGIWGNSDSSHSVTCFYFYTFCFFISNICFFILRIFPTFLSPRPPLIVPWEILWYCDNFTCEIIEISIRIQNCYSIEVLPRCRNVCL